MTWPARGRQQRSHVRTGLVPGAPVRVACPVPAPARVDPHPNAAAESRNLFAPSFRQGATASLLATSATGDAVTAGERGQCPVAAHWGTFAAAAAMVGRREATAGQWGGNESFASDCWSVGRLRLGVSSSGTSGCEAQPAVAGDGHAGDEAVGGKCVERSATSSGLPTRPTALAFAAEPCMAARRSKGIASHQGVSITPGDTALMRMGAGSRARGGSLPRGHRSRPRVRPCLEAPIEPIPPSPS